MMIEKILVVDDAPLQLHRLCEDLNNLGYACSSAIDGAEAYNKWNEKKYDLIITDVHMPNMSGLDLIERVRQTDKEIPILVLSADNRSEITNRARSSGASGYLVKPLAAGQIKQIIEKLGKPKVEDKPVEVEEEFTPDFDEIA